MKLETIQTALDSLLLRQKTLSEMKFGSDVLEAAQATLMRQLTDAIADLQQALASEKDTPTEAIAE